MVSYSLTEVILLSSKTLILVITPMLLAMMLSAILIAVLQSATGIRDQILNYSTKLVCFTVLAYLFAPAVIEAIQEIFLICYQ